MAKVRIKASPKIPQTPQIQPTASLKTIKKTTAMRMTTVGTSLREAEADGGSQWATPLLALAADTAGTVDHVHPQYSATKASLTHMKGICSHSGIQDDERQGQGQWPRGRWAG